MELLDIVDEKGNPTGETVPREVAHREGIRHLSLIHISTGDMNELERQILALL